MCKVPFKFLIDGFLKVTKLSSELEKIAPFWVLVLFSMDFFQVGKKKQIGLGVMYIYHISCIYIYRLYIFEMMMPSTLRMANPFEKY